MTCCASLPPLSEAIKIFDFLLAYGVHMNILIVVAHLFLMRDSILTEPS